MAEWAETLSFTNQSAAPATTVSTKTNIYTPPGAGQWAFSHGPDVTYFAGQFFVMFTNGRVGEGERGCRVAMRKSPDFSTWSDALFIGPTMGQYGEALHLAGGFMQHDGVLYAFYAFYEYDPRLIPAGFERPQVGDVGHLYMKTFFVSTTDGVTWTAPKEVGPNIAMNRPPTRTASGRLIMPGEARYDWTDDPTGRSGWVYSGIAPGLAIDGPDSLLLTKDKQGWDTTLAEGSFIQKDSGELVMFLRSGELVLWVTRSFDDGVTWSEPGRTRFAHAQAKFHAGRFSAGKFFILGNPAPNREILSVWTSSTGNAWGNRYDIANAPYTLQYPGFAKGGSYGYPSLLEKDGEIFAVCSQGKEAISGYRFAVPS